MTRDIVLFGVDGGNTKSVAVASTPDGTIVGTGRVVRGADIYRVPAPEALRVFGEAVGLALATVPPSGDRVVHAAFSLAGADWPEDIALLGGLVRSRWPGAVVVNDAIGALRAAIPDGPGVVVVCGTGTATGARGTDGRTWHSSFWQETQGAHELGVRALQAVYRAELGIDPPTALTGLVLEATAEPSVEALLHHASGRGVERRRDPAVLAPVLLDAADAGDAAARDIVRRHGASLGATAAAAARQVGIARGERFALALTGGVLRHPAVAFRAAIVDAVRAAAPGAVVTPPALEPAAGALLLAFDAAGIAADERVRRRIAAGLASDPVFDTHPGRASAGAPASAASLDGRPAASAPGGEAGGDALHREPRARQDRPPRR